MTEVVKGIDAWPHTPFAKRPTSVALGIFDGVHKGHQLLLTQAVAWAKQQQLISVAFTFDPHPARLFKPEYAPRLLEPMEARIAHMQRLALDAVVVQPFNHALAQTSAEDFVRQVLVDTLCVKHVVVGQDFVFGHKQGGNIQTLATLGKLYDFTLHAMEQVRIDGMVASSTKVRELIGRGSLAGAEQIMGRRYRIYLRSNNACLAQTETHQGEPARIPLGEQRLAPGFYAAIAYGRQGCVGALLHIGHPCADNDGPIMVRVKSLAEQHAKAVQEATHADVVARLHSMPQLSTQSPRTEHFSAQDIQKAKDILQNL